VASGGRSLLEKRVPVQPRDEDEDEGGSEILYSSPVALYTRTLLRFLDLSPNNGS
jgi:hypothetical protein